MSMEDFTDLIYRLAPKQSPFDPVGRVIPNNSRRPVKLRKLRKARNFVYIPPKRRVITGRLHVWGESAILPP